MMNIIFKVLSLFPKFLPSELNFSNRHSAFGVYIFPHCAATVVGSLFPACSGAYSPDVRSPSPPFPLFPRSATDILLSQRDVRQQYQAISVKSEPGLTDERRRGFPRSDGQLQNIHGIQWPAYRLLLRRDKSARNRRMRARFRERRRPIRISRAEMVVAVAAASCTAFSMKETANFYITNRAYSTFVIISQLPQRVLLRGYPELPIFI